MFSFFKSSYSQNILTEVDIHSHLIYNIDDGALDIDNSIQLIKELYLLGYRKIITTPHISEVFPNSKEDILNRYNILRYELLKQNIDIVIEVAAEYYIDEYFINILEKDEELLTFGDKRYLLFEFSHFTPPVEIESLIYDIVLRGYTPVLAHPERYIYWHSNFENYKELKELDILFQINLNSINGYYNKNIQNIVLKLIKSGMVDFVGSDTHHMRHIKNLKNVLSTSLYKKIFKYNKVLNKTLLETKVRPQTSKVVAF